ncbi:MAG TPA: GntR family transcriptional regulator [Mycobacteriales bacterium]|jgi:DNA-binding GntR family transcriptional regulator|nr:GntR family transcriptional regulator [Mycobacteriales bacterium]
MAELVLDLDRSSPVPLYFQVSRQIEAAIERGDLEPGDRLENEIGLADRWGLSRPTMRRAIEELVDKGLLVRRRGIGTQVVHGRVKRKMELTSLFDDLARSGQQPTTEVLLHETVPVDGHVAERLGLPAGAEVVHLQRLRSSGGEPLAVMRNWLPVELAGSFSTEQLRTRGLYELIRATGVHLRVAAQRIGARGASAAEARLLAVRRGAPLLTMERTTYDGTGRAVELGSHVYQAETYSIEMTVVDR